MRGCARLRLCRTPGTCFSAMSATRQSAKPTREDTKFLLRIFSRKYGHLALVLADSFSAAVFTPAPLPHMLAEDTSSALLAVTAATPMFTHARAAAVFAAAPCAIVRAQRGPTDPPLLSATLAAFVLLLVVLAELAALVALRLAQYLPRLPSRGARGCRARPFSAARVCRAWGLSHTRKQALSAPFLRVFAGDTLGFLGKAPLIDLWIYGMFKGCRRLWGPNAPNPWCRALCRKRTVLQGTRVVFMQSNAGGHLVLSPQKRAIRRGSPVVHGLLQR